jgi:hypothetical protein
MTKYKTVIGGGSQVNVEFHVLFYREEMSTKDLGKCATNIIGVCSVELQDLAVRAGIFVGGVLVIPGVVSKEEHITCWCVAKSGAHTTQNFGVQIDIVFKYNTSRSTAVQ